MSLGQRLIELRKEKKLSQEEVAGKLKTVDPNCSMIKEAERIGISFGDQ